MSEKKIPVKSLGLVECDHEIHPAGEKWDCPKKHLGRLLEAGAVEEVASGEPVKRPPVKEAIAALAKVDSLEELATIESYEDRKTVLEAIEKRRAELQAGTE
jgi:hypothetical protein